MHKDMTAKEFIKWAETKFNTNSSLDNLDFSKHLVTYVKPSNPKLYNDVLELLQSGKIDTRLKFLSYIGTGEQSWLIR